MSFFPSTPNHLFTDTRTLNKVQLIENLQDQAQITLAQFIQIHHPTQPTRYFILFS